MTIRTKAVLIIFSICLLITFISMSVGILSSQGNLLNTIKNDMNLASILASELVSAAKQTMEGTMAETISAGSGASLLEGIVIPGVDLGKAMERFGDEGGLITTLRSYANHTPALLEELRSIPPLVHYAIIVHGIKGASYGICADAVGKQAEALEKAAKGGDRAFVESHTADFDAAACTLIACLATALAAIDAKYTRPGKEAPDAELLARIGSAAASYDMNALDEAMEELEKYRYERDADIVPWLRDCIDRSEFEQIFRRLGAA